MDEEHMHAVFHEEFRHDRRPKHGVAFVVKPGRHSLPRDVVEAAIAAGKAEEIKPAGRPPKKPKNI